TVMCRDAAGNVATSTFLLTVTPVNDSPQISAIPNLETTMGQPIGPVRFVIGDAETPAENLMVTADCSNALIPPTNIQFGGSGSNRTVRLLPAAGIFGFCVVTLHVQDGDGAIAERSFEVLVDQTNGPPEIAVDPVGGTFAAGIPLQLRVIATGPGPLKYRWQRNG